MWVRCEERIRKTMSKSASSLDRWSVYCSTRLQKTEELGISTFWDFSTSSNIRRGRDLWILKADQTPLTGERKSDGASWGQSWLWHCFVHLHWFIQHAREAESARAITGRRCPHSGEGEGFLKGKSENRSQGRKWTVTPRATNRPFTKIGVVWQKLDFWLKTEILGQKKAITS